MQTGKEGGGNRLDSQLFMGWVGECLYWKSGRGILGLHIHGLGEQQEWKREEKCS